jgi:excisionase family DNA binding protein
MTTNDEWLTVHDAAKLSGYHPESIRELVRQGKIKAQKFSIVYRVDRESLLAYLTSVQTMGEKRGRKPKKSQK